jgi:hypothetical protein
MLILLKRRTTRMLTLMKWVIYFFSREYLGRQPGFDPITFTFNENSNCWQENLLEVIRQNIAG